MAKQQMLRHEPTGDLYIYTPALATRNDMVREDGDEFEIERQVTPPPPPPPPPPAPEPEPAPEPIVAEEDGVESEAAVDEIFDTSE
jgi:hypothetical protein